MSKNILIGVTGSIAAYKSADLVSALVKLGHNVKVIMTQNATQFITPLTLETLSHNPVSINSFASQGSGITTEHIALARWADLVCVAPASADFITKYAHGFADNLLLTELAAYTGNVIIAPAMNHAMYENSTTQNALNLLHERQVTVISPGTGVLACGEVGIGKMATVESILEAIVTECRLSELFKGQRFLITAGPTRAYLDPVRFISNPSTGKMGFALAAAAKRLGAEVTLISGPHDENLRFTPLINVETADEMWLAVENELKKSTKIDVFIGAAAVNDFMPLSRADEKTSKPRGHLTIEFRPEVDIISKVSSSPSRPNIVTGFAAETHDHVMHAQNKLARKQLDYIVVNDVSGKNNGFASNNNAVQILSAKGNQKSFASMPKQILAFRLLEWIDADYRQSSSLSPAAPLSL